jgi:hypothetical protein
MENYFKDIKHSENSHKKYENFQSVESITSCLEGISAGITLQFNQYRVYAKHSLFELESKNLESITYEDVENSLRRCVNAYCCNNFVLFSDAASFLQEHDPSLMISLDLINRDIKKVRSDILARIFLESRLGQQIPSATESIMQEINQKINEIEFNKLQVSL